MFLVKCGEDLRLDHRLETLFSVMNQVYALDPMCRQRKLQLRTYKVIPMTTCLGLIEWMQRTMTLKEFLQQAMTNSEYNFYYSNRGPAAAFQHWGLPHQSYVDLYKKYSWSDTVTAFRSRENLVPWDLLRRGYLRLSAGPEAYFTLKCNGATSHALLCVSHYIAGIGDRHLSNFMIDLDTGNMVGIDFGHAFGSATQFLGVPELMPFRLTRQIRNLSLPVGEKGLTQGTMIHALHALRTNHDLLLCTMDVFIKEPSLDWKQNAIKQSQKQTEQDELQLDQAWYPKQKIAYARRKLEGHNPAFITRDELKLGHSRSKGFDHFVRVVMGDSKHDIRAQLGPSGLTVDQQVACLLNQATDPNLLGRVWIGWEAWM
ncbi:hypothetical protein NP493_979g00000 [Ridgeia piscesae]|uniref:Non-specific serine/threonine protein kinase n=1 Tax=Ridgeia piscesae TaxID=27915 RepID=A0AAD9KJD5_RIDPI|nr:hypothetical protein NP493_979g00000 [Ridgeia piscesae]